MGAFASIRCADLPSGVTSSTNPLVPLARTINVLCSGTSMMPFSPTVIGLPAGRDPSASTTGGRPV